MSRDSELYSVCLSVYTKRSTDKFSTIILVHLFRPLCALDPPHSFCSIGFVSLTGQKIYTNLRVYFISDS